MLRGLERLALGADRSFLLRHERGEVHGVPRLERGDESGALLLARETAQERQVELVDDARRVALETREIGESVRGIPHRVGDGRTVHQRESLPQRHAARALALARALARRSAEEIEEAVGQLEAGVD